MKASHLNFKAQKKIFLLVYKHVGAKYIEVKDLWLKLKSVKNKKIVLSVTVLKLISRKEVASRAQLQKKIEVLKEFLMRQMILTI